MLRAILVFAATVFLSSASRAGDRLVESPSIGPTVGDSTGRDTTSAFQDGLLLTGWSNTKCNDTCIPAESLLCEECSDLCSEPPVSLRFSVPMWISEIHGNSVIRGNPAPVNVTSRDMFEAIDDVNFAAVGRLEADAGRWGLFIDGGYVNLSAEREFAGGRIDLSKGIESAIVESFLTYDLSEDKTNSFDASPELLIGARYWLLGGDVTITGPRGNTISTSGRQQWVDPLIGARIVRPLADNLLMRLRADVGGFGAASDFTWNVEALGEYRCSECCGLQLGYRVLDVDYANGDFAYDVNYRGPIALLVFDF